MNARRRGDYLAHMAVYANIHNARQPSLGRTANTHRGEQGDIFTIRIKRRAGDNK